MNKIINVAISCIGSAVCALLGGCDNFIIVLSVFMGLDIILGITNALVFKSSNKTKDGAYKSTEMRKGLMRKVGILACVIVSCMLDRLLNIDYLRNCVIIFFTINEGMSIIENVGLMGVPIPKAIVKALTVLKDKYEGEENDEDQRND